MTNKYLIKNLKKKKKEEQGWGQAAKSIGGF